MDTPQSSNISAHELDEETRTKLRGDTIGDTLYSESFVIRTLMKLSDLSESNCTTEMEEDLCFLWDMTTEKDVCQFLFQLNYPSLVCTSITTCTNQRFIEILIGILANILLTDCRKDMSESQVKTIISELHTDDPLVLLQIMRFLEALAYGLPEKVRLLGEEVIEGKMHYILNYSENFELITQTMKTLVQLTENYKLDEFEVNSLLFKAVITGFDTIFSVETNNFEIELDTEETSRIVKIFFTLLSNMCLYAQKYNHDDDIPTSINQSVKLAVTICKILKYFTKKENIFPLLSDLIEYITAIQIILTTRDVNVVQDVDNQFFQVVFNSSCKMLFLLYSSRAEVLDGFNTVLEFVGCLINLVDEMVVLFELKTLHHKRGVIILNLLREGSRFFDFDISDKLRFLFSEFK